MYPYVVLLVSRGPRSKAHQRTLQETNPEHALCAQTPGGLRVHADGRAWGHKPVKTKASRTGEHPAQNTTFATFRTLVGKLSSTDTIWR